MQTKGFSVNSLNIHFCIRYKYGNNYWDFLTILNPRITQIFIEQAITWTTIHFFYILPKPDWPIKIRQRTFKIIPGLPESENWTLQINMYWQTVGTPESFHWKLWKCSYPLNLSIYVQVDGLRSVGWRTGTHCVNFWKLPFLLNPPPKKKNHC